MSTVQTIPYSEFKGDYFIVDNEFYHGHDQLLEKIAEDYGSLNQIPEDWQKIGYVADHEPIINMNLQRMAEYVAEWGEGDRYTEEGEDYEWDGVINAFYQCFDFDKFQKLCPKAYYQNSFKKLIITKGDISDLDEE